MDFLSHPVTLPFWALIVAAYVGHWLIRIGEVSWSVWRERKGEFMP